MNPTAIIEAVCRATTRMVDRGLAIRVLRDEAKREMDAAREYLESGVFCARCGGVFRSNDHGCTCQAGLRRWVA